MKVSLEDKKKKKREQDLFGQLFPAPLHFCLCLNYFYLNLFCLENKNKKKFLGNASGERNLPQGGHF